MTLEDYRSLAHTEPEFKLPHDSLLEGHAWLKLMYALPYLTPDDIRVQIVTALLESDKPVRPKWLRGGAVVGIDKDNQPIYRVTVHNFDATIDALVALAASRRKNFKP